MNLFQEIGLQHQERSCRLPQVGPNLVKQKWDGNLKDLYRQMQQLQVSMEVKKMVGAVWKEIWAD